MYWKRRTQIIVYARKFLSGLVAVIGIAACAGPTPQTETPFLVPDRIQSRVATIKYTIQVGAFSTTQRAASHADQLQSAGLDAYYFIDSDGFCKVRFERYDTKESARRRALALQARGVIADFYIVQPGLSVERPEPQAALGQSIVETAQRFVGTPYRWGGTSAQSGFDCSGLTMTVYRLNGLELPRNSVAQFRAGTPVPRHALRYGDLVFFATGRSTRVSHVGIYSGQGKFIHASGSGKRIRTASLSNSYFKSRFKGARRYF